MILWLLRFIDSTENQSSSAQILMSQDLLTQKVAKVHEISLQRSPLLFHINMEPEKRQLGNETQNKQITIFWVPCEFWRGCTFRISQYFFVIIEIYETKRLPMSHISTELGNSPRGRLQDLNPDRYAQKKWDAVFFHHLLANLGNHYESPHNWVEKIPSIP